MFGAITARLDGVMATVVEDFAHASGSVDNFTAPLAEVVPAGIKPPESRRKTLFAVDVVDVSLLVTYLLEELGIPLVPARASFSSCVGTLPSLSPTKIGIVALTGATETLPIPLTVVDESGEPAIATPSTYAFVAN